jgi:uncharacterized protein
MKKTDAILDTLRRGFPTLQEQFAVHRIGIFGSFARGDQNSRSDIDVLVEFSRPVGFTQYMKLESYLRELLARKVDLVTANAIKPQMRQSIIEDLVYT